MNTESKKKMTGLLLTAMTALKALSEGYEEIGWTLASEQIQEQVLDCKISLKSFKNK